MSQPTARQIAKSILQGNAPERPLAVPIVFSLGAKIENLSRRAYLENPTKISNALRQIRAHLRTDGVSCYFENFLEMEALGLASQWDSANQTRTAGWPGSPRAGELPKGLRSPEDAAKSAPVRVGVEVIRRLNSILRDEPLLMAGVSGPFTLAARLTQMTGDEISGGAGPSDSVLEVASSTITKTSAAFVEAGAHLIFIREECLPLLSVDLCGRWQSLLAPVFNIIRFYEALPVVQLPGGASMAANAEVISQQSWDAILCSSSHEFANRVAASADNFKFGISLPAETLFAADGPSAQFQPPAGARPVLLTTEGDVPASTDLKRLMTVFETTARQI
jgi:hypothetical protein